MHKVWSEGDKNVKESFKPILRADEGTAGTILPVLRLIRVYIIASVLEFQREEEEKEANSRCWKERTESRCKASIMCVSWKTARTLGQSKPRCLENVQHYLKPSLIMFRSRGQV